MTTVNSFAHQQKSDAVYLDIAANDHGDEKGALVHRALTRLQTANPHVVEIGPGGGAAVQYLASKLTSGDRVRMTLIEAPGVMSHSLTQAMDAFTAVGTCNLMHGWAKDLSTLIAEPVDVISASALMHEVYSYGGAYAGLHTMMRVLPTVIRHYGFFVYRDVYAVDAPTLHERVVHCYSSQSWLQFLRMFVPHYLVEGAHPYHHHDDEVVARQNSRIVPVAELDTHVCAVIEAPVGLFREVQRHYITLRDHVWRSGILGFEPILDGELSVDWVDFRSGHKRVHYTLTDSVMASRHPTALLAVSERYGDHYVIDGDIFDAVTDAALMAFLAGAELADSRCEPTWHGWLAREGRETYAYLTADDLLTAFAMNSLEGRPDQDAVLMPVCAEDVCMRDRRYYNRFLAKRLANPLVDAKQLILFQNIPAHDAHTVQRALATLQQLCSKRNVARLHTAIHWRG
ncbi:hypothetical protein NONO_c14540 [Nocardia nova SH22a]|uniref:Methyltransferase domain-containing protein n=2 Tax=Nocardia nova TaxID=37330 RepID=W5TAM4_9NOCA|nr:hypothetical protein NONO_c14540 [Nocardia nova SH22a]